MIWRIVATLQRGAIPPERCDAALEAQLNAVAQGTQWQARVPELWGGKRTAAQQRGYR